VPYGYNAYTNQKSNSVLDVNGQILANFSEKKGRLITSPAQNVAINSSEKYIFTFKSNSIQKRALLNLAFIPYPPEINGKSLRLLEKQPHKSCLNISKQYIALYNTQQCKNVSVYFTK
jgi:DNA-binding beta-propeller fold protein YncE